MVLNIGEDAQCIVLYCIIVNLPSQQAERKLNYCFVCLACADVSLINSRVKWSDFFVRILFYKIFKINKS